MAYSLSGEKKTEYITGRKPAPSDGPGWVKDTNSDLIWSTPYNPNKNKHKKDQFGHGKQ